VFDQLVAPMAAFAAQGEPYMRSHIRNDLTTPNVWYSTNAPASTYSSAASILNQP
jgi:hypothetical protein